nr:DNA-repair protein XRCC1 [Tanacetum cinerariifolium]
EWRGLQHGFVGLWCGVEGESNGFVCWSMSLGSKETDEQYLGRKGVLYVLGNRFAKEDGKRVDEKRLISPPESPESSPINETSKLLQDNEVGEPKDDVVQKHNSQPDPSEMKKIKAEGILTCLQDAIDSLNKGEFRQVKADNGTIVSKYVIVESPESSPINETSKLLQDNEVGEPKDDVVQKHSSQVRE